MATAEIPLPSPKVNEAEADDEDLNYGSYYDEEFYSKQDDEASSPLVHRKSPEVPDLPARKRSLDDVAEPVRLGTPPKKLKVDVEVDVSRAKVEEEKLGGARGRRGRRRAEAVQNRRCRRVATDVVGE
ncbi:hypothetical protein IW262DRAFT_1486745 [Armillaria fumosa]|nr:hypothetical protein IW262DRAFT_1486745 [Armillaria fumosa]